MARKIFLLALIATLPALFCAAQRWRARASDGGIIYTEGGEPVNEETVRTAREIASHSTGTPNWTNAAGFEQDVFTFVRIIRDWSPFDSPSAGSWITDFPDSDLNLSFRLQQMTSLKVDPDGRVMRLSDADLFNYPWIYMVEPGSLLLLKVAKNKLQTPNIRQGTASQDGGVTWERHRRKEGGWEECTEMHVRAILDGKGRIMILAVHNCDNGDGWEREGENDYFFHEFSEKRAYPLGINVIFYLMTH